MRLSYSPDTSTSRVAVVGRAVHTDEKVLEAMCDALERKKVPARWVDASQSCLSCLVPRQRVEAVVCAFHDALRLDIAPRSGVSCLPYAGRPA